MEMPNWINRINSIIKVVSIPNLITSTTRTITSNHCLHQIRKFIFKMDKPCLLLISSSNVHGYAYLEYAQKDITAFFERHRARTILFIPYALPEHDAYLAKVRRPLEAWGFKVEGLHRAADPAEAIRRAEGIFVGGGNTFLLLKSLYEKDLLNALRRRVLEDGVPYMGASAGTNVACRTIHNTNDMPVVHPPSFDALRLVNFNINPHYLDAPGGTHKGETREERIEQYHALPVKYDTYHVLAMREGCHLLVEGEDITLLGISKARLFLKRKAPEEFDPGEKLSFLQLPEHEIQRRRSKEEEFLYQQTKALG